MLAKAFKKTFFSLKEFFHKNKNNGMCIQIKRGNFWFFWAIFSEIKVFLKNGPAHCHFSFILLLGINCEKILQRNRKALL